MQSIESLGFGPFFSSQLSVFSDAHAPGRVVAEGANAVEVAFADGDRWCAVPARIRDGALAPVVGDFVLVDGAGPTPVVARVLDRRTRLSRNAAGRGTAEQVLAANVDRVIVVQGLDGDVNARRLERYLAAIWSGGAEPAVVLTKADLADPGEWLERLGAVAPGVPIVAVAALDGQGVEDVAALVPEGVTAVFAGSSGAGKSTLVNALLGAEARPTAPVREHDHRGKHTTTDRRLFRVPGGGAVIDGPGIRELRLWDGAGLERAFEDVAALAEGCRFRDCAHEDEPGCAVLAAVERGELEPERLESLRKLRKEIAWQEARRDGAARAEERRKWRVIHRSMRAFKKPGR